MLDAFALHVSWLEKNRVLRGRNGLMQRLWIQWHMLLVITFMWNSSTHGCSFVSIAKLYKSLLTQIKDLNLNEGKIKSR